MIAFPGIKINLGLYITERRPDGFHNLETIFYPLNVNDVLEVVPSNHTQSELIASGRHIDGSTEQNLVWKAYQLLKDKYPEHCSAPVQIYIHKNIPMGAGLGGGSSNAAAMLQLLNNYFKLELNEASLLEYAAQLGSDCAFFIKNKACFAQGRGEILEPIALDLGNYTIQLICPNVHVATRWAFGHITPKHPANNLKESIKQPVKEWQSCISNDFEKPVFKEHPVLASIKQQLIQGGALYASMSGSGASLYGIFPKGQQADITASVSFEEYIL